MKSIYEGCECTDGSFRLDTKPRRRIRAGTKWVPPKPTNKLTREEWRAFYAEHEGDFIVLAIERNLFGFGRALPAESMGYYDLLSPTIPPIDEIERHPLLFIVPGSSMALFSGRWRVIGRKPLPDELKTPIKYHNHVRGTDFVQIYVGDEDRPRPYAGEDLTKMESINGWWPWSLEERLRSHFAGRPDLETEHLRIPVERAERIRREYFERHPEAKRE